MSDQSESQRSAGSPTALQAVLRRPYTFAWILSLLIAGIIGLASIQPTQYRTEGKYAIGGARVTNQELPGYITSTNAQDAIVARLIDTTPTIDRIVKATGYKAEQIRTSVSATNIPDSPIIRIRATGSTPEMAKALSTAAGDALQASLADLEKSGGQVPDLTLTRYLAAYEVFLQADAKATAANAAVDRVQREIDDAETVTASMRSTLKKNQAKVIETQLVLAEAKAKSDGLKDLYAQQLKAASSGTDLQIVSTSSFVENTGRQQVQLVVGVGVPLALALACLAVWLLEQRKHDRARQNA